MNINEAKQQIKNAMIAYLAKNEFGEYKIPIEKQRPVFLMGPPGIGKTAIMEQIASELGVGLVAYSMTHHTRQSALGLPFIVKKNYGGREYDVSEYTMSEIIASVYDMMESTGLKQGILFLDEINCVSETLSPSMLQFLQYKVFGRHRVPDGWIVVTAGNPPEYNNSVHEFDIVTWDRLKRIDIEPDYEAWKEYAYKKSTHPAITSYLDIKKGDFYKIETTIDGKSFVTARGWSDLSDMIKLYEENDIKVDSTLISQYLQHAKIAKEFSIYYDLFNKYRSDYQIDLILEGKAEMRVKSRARTAHFDERLSLLGLIIGNISDRLKVICHDEEAMKSMTEILRALKPEICASGKPEDLLESKAAELEKKLEKGMKSNSISETQKYVLNMNIRTLSDQRLMLSSTQYENGEAAFALIKKDFAQRVQDLGDRVAIESTHLTNAFNFCDEVFNKGQELLVLVTELTMNYYSAHFISKHGCKEYYEHNKDMLFYERQKEIMTEIDKFDLD